MALEKGGIPPDDRRAITTAAAFTEQCTSGKCNKRRRTIQGFEPFNLVSVCCRKYKGEGRKNANIGLNENDVFKRE